VVLDASGGVPGDAVEHLDHRSDPHLEAGFFTNLAHDR